MSSTDTASERVAGASATRGSGLHAAGTLWDTPTLLAARWTLRSYLRGYWLWAEALLVLLLYIAFFEYPDNKGDITYLCGFAGRVLVGLAALSTAIMVHRAFQARAYLPLAHLTSRAPLARGALLASAALRLPLFLELFVLYLRGHHQFGPGAGAEFWAGTLGFLVTCTLVAALVVVLSPPIATRLWQIGFLAWLVAALAPDATFGPLAPLLGWARLPLLPIVACYNFGQTGVVGGQGLLMLAVMAGYVAGLTWLAGHLLARRDLLLQ